MSKNRIGIVALVALLAACAPLAPAPGAQDVRIEGTPGAAVIYLVRTNPDLSDVAAPVVVNDDMVGATHAGTYIRLELPAGRHRMSGFASDNGSLTLNVERDRIYFIRHTVTSSYRSMNPESSFQMIDEARGRAAMAGASRAG
jgi:hypothetical protein